MASDRAGHRQSGSRSGVSDKLIEQLVSVDKTASLRCCASGMREKQHMAMNSRGRRAAWRCYRRQNRRCWRRARGELRRGMAGVVLQWTISAGMAAAARRRQVAGNTQTSTAIGLGIAAFLPGWRHSVTPAQRKASRRHGANGERRHRNGCGGGRAATRARLAGLDASAARRPGAASAARKATRWRGFCCRQPARRSLANRK